MNRWQRAAGCDDYVTKPYGAVQLLRTILGFLDATAFQSSAQHENDIKPVLRHADGRKNGPDLEENRGLGRSDDDLPASQHQRSKAVVQLHNF